MSLENKKVTRRKFGEILIGAASVLFSGSKIGVANGAKKYDSPIKIDNYQDRKDYLESQRFQTVFSKLEINTKIIEGNKNKKNFPVPVEGMVTELKDANFSIYPDKLDFTPGRTLLVVSDFWQTACLYDEEGNKFKIYNPITGRDSLVMYQVGTGKSTHPTELGLYEIEKKGGKNYVSNSYPKAAPEDKKKGIRDGGAKMPWALLLSKVLSILNGDGKVEVTTEGYKGTAVHGRVSVSDIFTVTRQSHGCIGLEESMAELTNYLMDSVNNQSDIYADKGSFVLVISNEIPKMNSLKELIKQKIEKITPPARDLSKAWIEKQNVDPSTLWNPSTRINNQE